MATTSNTTAADAHDAAAKTHRMAVDAHQKGDNTAGADHAGQAMKLSETAHKASTTAMDKSSTAAKPAAKA